MANSFKYGNKTVHVGDRVAVHQRIVEEGRTRTQIFDGLVIATKGRGDNRTFMVRKIASGNIGVERIYPVGSPFLSDIVIKSRGSVRRSKLYYLRGRIGRRATRVKEKIVSDARSQAKPRPTGRTQGQKVS